MNNLHKGKDNIFKDMYWVIRHMFNKNKGVCPRCGYGAFEHGFFPNNEFYCTECGLWEPDWDARNRWLDDITKHGVV